MDLWIFPSGIQMHQIVLGLVAMDIWIRTAFIQLNPMQVEPIWILDNPSPLSGLAMDRFSISLFRQCPGTHIHGQDSVH